MNLKIKMPGFLTNLKTVFWAIIILGLIIRLYKINTPLLDWHSFRQVDTASVSKYFLRDGINMLEPRYHDISRVQSGMFNPEGYRFVEFPVYNAIHSIAYKIFPVLSFDAVGRLVSIVFALISSIFLYKISAFYFGKNVGILSMFLYLTLPFNVYFTRVILPEPLAVMLGLSGLWFFIKYSKEEKLPSLFIFSILMSVAILVKPYLVFYNIYPVYFFLKKYGYRKVIVKKEVIASLLIIFLPFIFWRLWIAGHPEGIPFWKWTFNGDGVRFKPAFWYWIFGERIGKLILGVWGIYPFIIGSLNNRRNPFLIAFLLGAFLYLSVIATANVRHDYYQTLIVPVISIVLALGVHKMFEDSKKIKYGMFLPLGIMGMMYLISAFQVKEYYKINHPEIINAGLAVERLTPEDALVIASYNGDTAFLYHTGRRGWPVVELPIEELIKEGAQYFTSVNLNDSQTIEFMKRFPILEKTDSYVVLKLK